MYGYNAYTYTPLSHKKSRSLEATNAEIYFCSTDEYDWLRLLILMYSLCLFCFQLLATPPPPPPLSTLPSRIAAHSTPTGDSFSNLDSPPPLPSRNRTVTSPVLGISPTCTSPPPLPPRQYLHSPSNNVDGHQDSANSTACTDLSVSIHYLEEHLLRVSWGSDCMLAACERSCREKSMSNVVYVGRWTVVVSRFASW